MVLALFGGVIESSGKPTEAIYYIVHNHVGNSMSDAKNIATQVKMSGGAGYIIEKNEKYYVALCAYQNEEDAKLIVTKNQGSDVMKYKLNLKCDGEEEFRKDIVYIANRLYDLALKYEMKEVTSEDVKVQVAIMKKQLVDKYSVDDSSYSEKLYFYLTSLDNIIKASDSNLCWMLRYEQIKFIVKC